MDNVIEFDRARETSSSNFRAVNARPNSFADYSPRERPDWQTKWQTAIRERLSRILALGSGWDGYAAPHISPETAIFTSQILERLCRPNLPVPDISPLSDGSLMLEWISPAQCLTLEIERPNSISVICEKPDGTLEETRISSDMSLPEKKLADFVAPPLASAAIG